MRIYKAQTRAGQNYNLGFQMSVVLETVPGDSGNHTPSVEFHSLFPMPYLVTEFLRVPYSRVNLRKHVLTEVLQLDLARQAQWQMG